MVLQDLGNTPSDSFSENSYPTDNDPYASSSSDHGYDASSLPKPIPLLGPFMGFSEGVIRYRVEQTSKYAEKRIGRPMTGEETHALASHLYKMEQTKSYFTALGVGYGAWRWYSTTSTSRFPLYQPKPENIDPQKFAFVRGPAAFYARHSFRFLGWYFVAGELGKLTGQLIAQPLAARDTASDPRLAQFGNDLKGAVSADQQKGRETAERMQAERYRAMGRNPDGTAMEQPPHAGKPQWGPLSSRRPPPATPPPSSDPDDMSPTAGSGDWPSTPAIDSASPSAPTETQKQRQRPAQQPQLSSAVGSRAGRRTEEADFASPTGGLFQDEVQNQTKPGESAWERLRRGDGAIPGARPPSSREEPRHREQKEGSTLGDSFTFVETEDERKRAQGRAQQEFDERIERERQGRDFDDEKRW